MSGEALKQEIRKTAEEKARLTLSEAEAKAEQMLADAGGEAKRILDARTQDAQRRLEQLERSEAAKARMECRRRILGLQSQYVERAFGEAESRLNDLPKSDPAEYRRMLARFIAEGFHELGGESAVVVAREADRKLVEGVLRDSEGRGRRSEISIASEPLRSGGGIVLRTEDGRSYFVNTFESRLLRAREELRARVSETLLGRG